MLFLSRVYLFSQFLITNLQEKIINSDLVTFVTRFIPGFDPIYPTFCKLIPLRGVISYTRYEFHMTSDVFSLAKIQTTSRTTPQPHVTFPGSASPSLWMSLLVDQLYACNFCLPHTMSDLE